jgi:predicted alpha/beta-fold hydrolase
MWSVALVFATIVIGGALDARRRLPDLQPWHRIVPQDGNVRTLTDSSTLADYLAIEDRAFRTVRERIEDTLDSAWKLPANRYNRDGHSHPSRFGVDWNRTQILSPDVAPVGGALLVHGLTDAPYALRSIGEALRERGYYVVVLRVPGHGTVPAGLIGVTWEDWLAAVRVAARAIRTRIGAGTPLLLVGYSNGGAQVLKYALDVVEGSGDPRADRLVLLSPMIGVTRFAWLARVISLLGPLPPF